MNTHTIQWQAFKRAARNAHAVSPWQASEPLVTATRWSARTLVAAVPALAILVGAAWAVAAGPRNGVLEAITWAAGFVFLALAVESSKPVFHPLLATGLALLVLALLGKLVAAEFALVAATIIAGWVATAILKKTA